MMARVARRDLALDLKWVDVVGDRVDVGEDGPAPVRQTRRRWQRRNVGRMTSSPGRCQGVPTTATVHRCPRAGDAVATATIGGDLALQGGHSGPRMTWPEASTRFQAARVPVALPVLDLEIAQGDADCVAVVMRRLRSNGEKGDHLISGPRRYCGRRRYVKIGSRESGIGVGNRESAFSRFPDSRFRFRLLLFDLTRARIISNNSAGMVACRHRHLPERGHAHVEFGERTGRGRVDGVAERVGTPRSAVQILQRLLGEGPAADGDLPDPDGFKLVGRHPVYNEER